MFTAKEAYAKTMALIKKDEDALIAKCLMMHSLARSCGQAT